MSDTPPLPGSPTPRVEQSGDTGRQDGEESVRDAAAPASATPGTVTSNHPDEPHPSALDGPARVGDYAILRKIGEGGMGAVYLAEDERLGRKVAIKLMKRDLAANRLDRERFVREARAAANVESDHIVPTLHIGELPDGTPFIVMPLLQGEMLDARLKRGEAAHLGVLLKVARDVAEGLAAAHAKGVIHRDIKPGNVWLEGDPGAKELGQQVRRCKVLDFGLARSLDKEDAQITASGVILGTPAYMSPEQAKGEKLDPRTDLFSLGVTLYRMATGQLPFNGPTSMAVLIALTTETPTPVGRLAPHLPWRVADLIDRLMRKDPAERPQSALEVAETVRAIAKELQGKKSSPAAPTAPAPPARPSPSDTSASQPQPIPEPPYFAPAEEPSGRPQPDPESLPYFAPEEEADNRPARARRNRSAEPPNRMPLVIAATAAAVFLLALLALWLGGVFGGRTGGTPTTPHVKMEQPNADPDRAAAMYVLSLGGSVNVNGEGREINPGDELPKGPFRLTRVALANKPNATAAGLSAFKGCTHLEYLGLLDTPVGDAGLAHFAGCKGLNYAYLKGTGISSAGLAALRDCTRLIALDLSDTKVDDAAVDVIKRFTKLKTLVLNGTSVTARGARELADALPECEINWSGVTIKPGEASVPDRKAAEWALSVGGSVYVNDGEEEIFNPEGLPKGPFRLTQVTLTENEKATDTGLAAFKGCTNLTHIGLNNTPVGHAGLVNFAGCKNLTYLYLSHTGATDATLAAFKDCTGLQELNLSHTKVGDPGLEHVKRFTKLNYLYLEKTKVTAKGVEELAKALPDCEITWDGGTIKPKGGEADRKAADWVLAAGGKVHVNGEADTIKAAKELPEEPFRLTGVYVTAKVKDADLAVFKECKDLTLLYLVGTGITNAGLAHFKDCKNLTDLSLAGTKVDDDSVPVIKQFAKLMDLSVGVTGITAKGVSELAKALPKCRIQHDGGTVEPKEK